MTHVQRGSTIYLKKKPVALDILHMVTLQGPIWEALNQCSDPFNVFITTDFIELNVVVLFLFTKVDSVVDFGVLGQFPIGFQVSCFVRVVFEDDICLGVLIVP